MVARHIVSTTLQPLLFVVALCLSFSANSYELNVSINHNQVELGKPVTLFIHSSQTSVSLDNIDLTTLKRDFYIKNIQEPVTSNQQQTLSVTLYPRTTGHLSIPELYFIKTRSQPIPLKVKPAIDPKDNSEIEVKYSVSTHSPWKKQQVLVKLGLTSHSSILVIKTPDAYSVHSDIFSLDVSSNPTNNESNKLTQHTTGWAVFPRQAGTHQLELPAIQLVRDGITTHRFYPPLLQLDIKPLPVYIPATMPIGHLSFNINTPADHTIITDTIHNAEFSLKSEGVMPSTLPSIATQLKSREEISFYPASKKSIQSTSTQGIISEDRYTISYKTNKQGIINPGEIKLSYFDPDSGTIKSLSKTMGNSFSIHRGLLIFLVIAIVIAGYFLLIKIYGLLKLKWHCLSGYRQVLKLLPAINKPEDIKYSLMKIALAERWHDNLTLQQWLTHWSDKHAIPCTINIHNLEVVLYGRGNTDLEELKHNIRQLCFARWPIFRLLY